MSRWASGIGGKSPTRLGQARGHFPAIAIAQSAMGVRLANAVAGGIGSGDSLFPQRIRHRRLVRVHLDRFRRNGSRRQGRQVLSIRSSIVVEVRHNSGNGLGDGTQRLRCALGFSDVLVRMVAVATGIDGCLFGRARMSSRNLLCDEVPISDGNIVRRCSSVGRAGGCSRSWSNTSGPRSRNSRSRSGGIRRSRSWSRVRSGGRCSRVGSAGGCTRATMYGERTPNSRCHDKNKSSKTVLLLVRLCQTGENSNTCQSPRFAGSFHVQWIVHSLKRDQLQH